MELIRGAVPGFGNDFIKFSLTALQRLISLKDYVDENGRKHYKQNGAGQQIIQCCAHHAPGLHHFPCGKNGKDCRDAVNHQEAVPFSDGDKNIVKHVYFRADTASDQQNDEMQLIGGQIHTIDQFQERPSQEMSCHYDGCTADKDDTEDAQYIKDKFFDLFLPPELCDRGNHRLKYKFAHQGNDEGRHEQNTVIGLVFIAHDACHCVLRHII